MFSLSFIRRKDREGGAIRGACTVQAATRSKNIDQMLPVALTFVSLGCSNFAMEDAFGLSVRTEDTSPPYTTEDEGISLIAQPASRSSYGFVAFAAMKHGPNAAPLNASQGVKAGMNTKGLSCDKQALSHTTFPVPKPNAENIDGALFCRTALERFANVTQLKRGLASGALNFVAPAHDADDFGNGHFALRDAQGLGVVVEFVDGLSTRGSTRIRAVLC